MGGRAAEAGKVVDGTGDDNTHSGVASLTPIPRNIAAEMGKSGQIRGTN